MHSQVVTLWAGYRLEYQYLSGEVPKRSQRRRLEIGWSGNSGTWVRIPPSPPLSSCVKSQFSGLPPSVAKGPKIAD